MAHGCAAVVSGRRYTGLAKLTKNGQASLLENPKDPGEIAEAIESLLDRSIRKNYADKGRALARGITPVRLGRLAQSFPR